MVRMGMSVEVLLELRRIDGVMCGVIPDDNWTLTVSWRAWCFRAISWTYGIRNILFGDFMYFIIAYM